MTSIGVVGAGVMGRGIVQWAAGAAGRVVAYDTRPGASAEAVDFIRGLLDRSVEKGRMEQAARDDLLGRIVIADTLDDLAACDVIIEAIVEQVPAKRELFSRLEGLVSADAILCTNTSSLSVTEIAAGCRSPDRVAGLHFFNPVPMMKVVEVISGERTSNSVMRRIEALVRRTDHHPVLCKDSPGFVINHAGRGLYTEGLRLEQEQVAKPADIDRIVRDALGLRMGPFELFDLTGLDVSGEVLHLIYDGFQQEPRYRPAPVVRRRMAAGLYGRKSGAGFYDYGPEGRIEPPEPPVPNASPAAFACAGEAGPLADAAALLEASGLHRAPIESADLVLLAPIGDDATAAALAAGIDPAKAVAVDTLFPRAFDAGGRITLMGCPATRPDALELAQAGFAAAGLKVTVVADSPGFVAQRIAAMIVNIGCEIAQQGIASAADIEAGVTLGLGYPLGPLALGDKIGPMRVLNILHRLLAITGDPRYRPSLFLRRRALLGLPLIA